MHYGILATAVIALHVSPITAQQKQRNIWEAQYHDRTAVEMAAQFENARRPVFRHRADIVRMLDLQPGNRAAEIGAGSGFLSRMMSAAVGRTGRVIATELNPRMVDYMNARAKAEGLTNLQAIVSQPHSAGLDPGSTDVIVVVNTYSFFDNPRAMMQSISAALARGGLLMVVDFPPGGAEGVDPKEVIETADAAGLAFLDRDDRTIPSHFAVRFRKR